MSKNSLLKGAAIMAAAGLIVKLLGAVFRIPLANWIGSVGMANYSPAYSLYSVLLVCATAGLPVAISKMVSERCAVGQFREAERVFRLSRTLMMIIGIIGFIVMFFCADIIAELINLPGSALSMRATAIALLLVPIMSSYRGYFQGMQDMKPTAMSEVAEQTFRVVFGLTLAYVLLGSQFEFLGYTAPQRGAAGGCFGASAGAIGGLSVMLIVYMVARKKIKRRVREDQTTVREPAKDILKKIAVIAIPITIGAAIMPIVNMVDAAMVQTRLLASGWDAMTAESLYGQLTGFAAPVIQFPQVFMTGIVMSLVPMVSAAHRLNDTNELHGHISLGLRMTTIVSFPAGIGMLVLAEPILLLLYSAQEEAARGAASCLQIYSVGFVFLAIVTTITGALQGIGKQHLPVINMCIGLALKLIGTWTLTAVPLINVRGAAIGSAAAYLVAMILDIAAVKKYSGVRFPFRETVGKPLLSAVVMGVVVLLAYKGLFMLLGSSGTATLISILIGVIVYGLMVIKTKTIGREEMMTIPIGAKLARVCDRLRLW